MSANSRVFGSPTALNHMASLSVSNRIKLKQGLAFNWRKPPLSVSGTAWMAS